MSDLPDATEQLKKRLEALEQCVATLEPRVAALEHPLATRWPHPSPELEGRSAPEAAEGAALAPAGSMFSLLGRAMLGIAGAYVLRAVEEASSLPKLAVASAAIAYAFLWLVWAARTRRGPRFASAIYAGTSALILAPMLWELTLRFKVLPAALSAGVLCAYALAAAGLGWKRDLAPVVRVAGVASAGLALALALASHAMMPFIVVLLILAAICEFVPGLAHMPEVRALAALAADAAIWILIYIYFAPQAAGESYPPLGRAALLAPGIALFVLFAASVAVKSILRRRQIGVFDTIQTTIALLLAAVSVVDFGPPGSAVILGVVCLILSAASYAAVFTVFERTPERRNAAVFAAWGAALLLAGSFLCLPPFAMIMLLGAVAIAAMIVGSRRSRVAFEFYGMVFLLAAASASGLLNFLVSALVGTPLGVPAPGVWLIACSAILCYLAAQPGQGEAWKPQVLHLTFAALAAGAVAALLVDGLTGLTALFVQPGAHHLAFIRTLTLSAAALALVFGGAHWRRRELTRLGYAALALVAVKLVTEDLRHGHLGYIAASIFLVALTLLAAPRVARTRQKT
ncbi:MAG: hypothetical protein WB341_02235 [Terracidiphilus sp.]